MSAVTEADGEEMEAQMRAAQKVIDGLSLRIAQLEAELRAALANGDKLSPVGREPFGYFKAEPFGWTDCGPDDEGAIALYEAPQPRIPLPKPTR